MRDCNVTITSVNTTKNNVTIEVVKEEIVSICEYKQDKFVAVTVAKYDSDNNNVAVENYVIKGDNYDLLMSANPSFAPQKPANEYREADLWYVIDQVR